MRNFEEMVYNLYITPIHHLEYDTICVLVFVLYSRFLKAIL